MLTLGLDAGGSATRWVLLDAARDVVVARGEAGPASGHIFDPAVRARTFAAFEAIAAAVREHGVPTRIAGGITGLGAGTPEAVELAALLSAGLGTPAEAIALGDDLWIQARRLFPAGDGGILYAGTGAVAYGIDKAGNAVRIGGYGVVVDDAGGAWWIAVRGIRAVVRRREEGLGDGPLAEALAAGIGASDWPTIRAAVYSRDRGGVAAMAPFVAAAAADGDAAAIAILEEAGDELARLGTILARRMPCSRLAAVGGAFRLDPRILARVVSRMPIGVDLFPAEIDIPLSAAMVASSFGNPPV
jgi:glucosamine kinase